MKAIAFANASDEMWESAAKNSLRGRPFESLTTKLIEGMKVQPLYTDKTSINKEERQLMQQIIQHSKVHSSWRIIQPTYATDARSFIVKAAESLKNGNEAIYYDGRCGIEWDEENLKELAKLVTQKYPLCVQHINDNDSFLNLFHVIDKSERHKVRGPILHGSSYLPDDYINVRNTPISTVDIHHEGADIVTELAISLAIASKIITNGDLPIEKFPKHALFHFAIDTHFFPEIAKLRAFRILWHTFASAYHHPSVKVPVYAETSLRTYSKLDPNVNMLRAGNEAFSAVLGGVDMITVNPHTILTKVTEASERYARNVQLILKEEMMADYVKDVASGSYYIDTLTKKFADEAWELFLQIESFGGYEKYVSSGRLAGRINEIYQEQMSNVAKRDKILVGTNQYANPSDETPLIDTFIKNERRLSIPYEEYWQYFDKESIKVVILLFGLLKEVKPRADFVTSFLASAGIKATWSPTFASVNEGMEWMKGNQFDYGIICTPVGETANTVQQFDDQITRNLWLDVAGNEIEVSKWASLNISGNFIQGMNQLEKFAVIKDRWEAKK